MEQSRAIHSAGTSIGTHGGDILSMAKAMGCEVADLVDMSSNLTPFGMVPGLKEVIFSRFDEISYLPETGSETVREIFASRYGLTKDFVLAGNGTTEFIYAVPAVLGLRRAVIVTPTYADYRLASTWAGMETVDFNLRPEDDFEPDLDLLGKTLTGGELVFFCNPNNPTGRFVASADLHRFVIGHPDSFFLVDESYLPFLSEPSLLDLPLPDNLFVLSSFSKIYGIPGLRLGFLAATAENMARLSVRRKPWGVNRIAQLAGEFLMTRGNHYAEDVRQFVARTRPAFAAALEEIPGVHVVPGVVNFILCRLTGSVTADYLRERMLENRIMIRNCANFAGLDNHYFRLSLKDENNNNRCLAVLHTIIGGK